MHGYFVALIGKEDFKLQLPDRPRPGEQGGFDPLRRHRRYVADVPALRPQSDNDGVQRRMGYPSGDPDGWKEKRKPAKKAPK